MTIFSSKTTDVNGNDVVFDGADYSRWTARKSGSQETPPRKDSALSTEAVPELLLWSHRSSRKRSARK